VTSRRQKPGGGLARDNQRSAFAIALNISDASSGWALNDGSACDQVDHWTITRFSF